MEKPVATLDKGTACTSWNYCGQRLATGPVNGSRDPASSPFTTTSKIRVSKFSPSFFRLKFVNALHGRWNYGT